MPLPDLIEIVPLDKPVRAEITVPGSKSITNRALILAALAHGEVTLEGALWSEDTQVMVEALRKLGFEIKIEQDPDEFCNRQITVKGQGGRIANAGTPEQPLELFVGNAGTAARFLAALVCLGDGVYRLSGVPRMHERPQAALFRALRELGYRVDSANDKLPATIFGRSSRRESALISPNSDGADLRPLLQGSRGKLHACTVSITESSQFASALLLCARVGGWNVQVEGEDTEEASYVQMTKRMVEVFPTSGGAFQIEPDASSASYFWGAGEWVNAEGGVTDEQEFSVMVLYLSASEWQLDAKFSDIFAMWAADGVLDLENVSEGETDSATPWEYSRGTDLGDSIMTAITLAPLQRRPMRFVDLARLRLQECERVVALRTELTKCGARVVEEGDTLTIYPSKLNSAEIETYNDHRMAMCFAILGLKVPGIKIHNPACVKKTFPNFFQKLAAPPPGGLGATIMDARTGRKLEVGELFAD
jgi:3-phosphoshikimate 1-carboxyvinyltransferase